MQILLDGIGWWKMGEVPGEASPIFAVQKVILELVSVSLHVQTGEVIYGLFKC